MSVFHNRKNTKMSYGIVGLGRFGYALATELSRADADLLILDSDEEKVREMREVTENALVIKSLDKKSLAETGIQNCDVAVVCIGEHIETSILTTLHLVSLGVPKVVAKATSAEHGEILEKLGAEVVYPERDMAIRLANSLETARVLDYIQLSEKINISKLQIPEKLIGKSVVDMDLRGRFGLNIIAVENSGEVLEHVKPDYVFQKKDVLLVSGSRGQSCPAVRVAGGPQLEQRFQQYLHGAAADHAVFAGIAAAHVKAAEGEGKLCRTLPGGGLPGEYRPPVCRRRWCRQSARRSKSAFLSLSLWERSLSWPQWWPGFFSFRHSHPPEGPEDFLCKPASSAAFIFNLNNLCQDGNPDLLRRFRADGKADGGVYLLQDGRIRAGFPQGFLYPCCPAPASHHADIGMFFFRDQPQAGLIVLVSPGNDYEESIRIPRDFGQSLLKGAADHPVRSGAFCVGGEGRPVFQYSYRASDHAGHADDRDGYVAAAADYQLLFPGGKFTENPDSRQEKDACIFQTSYISGNPGKKAACSGFPPQGPRL